MRNHRRLFLLLGIIVILFGLCICFFPQAMRVVLSVIVGIILLWMGVIMIMLALTAGPSAHSGVFIFMGLFNAVLGFFILLSSTLFQSIYTIIIGIRTLLRGIILIVNSGKDKEKALSYRRAEAGLGVLLILLSLFMFFSPSERAILIAIFFGISVIVEGISFCIFALKMKTTETTTPENPDAPLPVLGQSPTGETVVAPENAGVGQSTWDLPPLGSAAA